MPVVPPQTIAYRERLNMPSALRRRRWIAVALAAAAAAVAVAVWLNGRRQKVYTASALGTGVKLTLVGTRLDALSGRLDRISARVLGEIAVLENLISIFRPGSDISRLNREGWKREVRVDARTFHLLRAALGVSDLTGGVFDICVLPAERSWGFKTERRRRVPEGGGRPVPRAGPGVIALRSDAAGRYARFLKKGVEIDLGGIGKGFVIDRAVAVLRASGLYGALVDIGGDAYCMGKSARGTPWRMGLRNPRGPGVIAILKITDRAVATSGDYENFFVEEGKRYSHIFDPRTGKPAESGLVSATVIAPTCTEADALATSLMVLGREKGTALVERLPGVECLLIGVDGGRLAVSTSSGWRY